MVGGFRILGDWGIADDVAGGGSGRGCCQGVVRLWSRRVGYRKMKD